jgi:hypothetical protein
MLTSGLISLNVHEALAFDGTEICVHPDIFNTPGANQDPHGSALHTLSMGSNSKNSANNASHDDSTVPASSYRKLEVGDLIEVRIWDPNPIQMNNNKVNNSSAIPSTRVIANAASIIRRNPASSGPVTSVPQSVTPTDNNSVASGSVENNRRSPSKDNSELVNIEGVDPFSDEIADMKDKTTLSVVNSLQYSEHADEEQDSVGTRATTREQILNHMETVSTTSSRDNTRNDTPSSPSNSPKTSKQTMASLAFTDGTTHTPPPPTKTVVTSLNVPPGGRMPPVFPRARTSTADFPRTTAKPLVSGGGSTGTPTTTKPSRSILKSHHKREISDMTVETALGTLPSNPTGWSGQLPLAGNLGTGSEDLDDDFDVDDDIWTQISSTHNLRMSFVMKVTEKSLTSLKGSARTQVSILRRVADLYELSSYDMVTISKINEHDKALVLDTVSADFVVVTIKDQFISRGDMHVFQETLIGSWIYEGQRLLEPSRGFQAYVQEIRHSDKLARSGIVTEATTITFRSRSARIMWLVQMSSEMWDYASPFENNRPSSRCEIYFDRLIDILHQLFAKWKELDTTHSVTVIFFSRTFVGDSGSPFTNEKEFDEDFKRDIYGRQYEDHFRLVIEHENPSDWETFIVSVKEAFVRYPIEVQWNLKSGSQSRRPSSASQGNVLEAINVTLNLLQYHYLDRDLHRTGNSIVVISAGNGVFEVDKGLAGISYQRMMDNGIGSDMLSLGLPPLHTAPFFLYVNLYQDVDPENVDGSETFYEVPHWMNLSFASYDGDSDGLGRPRRKSEFTHESNAVKSNNLSVAPNGFLLPRPKEQIALQLNSSPLLRPKSFSVALNGTSSPKKPPHLTQERQLIAGRDFYDILEACRPRNIGALPSPLRALLDMQSSLVAEKEHDEVSAVDSDDDVSTPVEWGALESKPAATGDFLTINRRKISIGNESFESTSRAAPIVAPTKQEELDIHEKSSQSSSFASQISNHLLGASFDRSFLSPHGQIQRCPSLEFERTRHDDNNTISRENEEGEDDNFQNLRAMMKSRDALSLRVTVSPEIVPQAEPVISSAELSANRHGPKHRPMSGIGVFSGQRRTMASQGSGAPGGIGGALAQYRASSVSRTEAEKESAYLGQGASSGSLFSSTRIPRHFGESAPVGLSPLLLPPAPISGRRDVTAEASGSRFAVFNTEGSNIAVSSTYGPIVGSLTAIESRLNNGNTGKGSGSGSGSSGFNGLPSSPPTGSRMIVGNNRFASSSQRPQYRDTGSKGKSAYNSKRKKAFNPFRQQDEDEVLAKNSHNRRRWSHVFPAGELEFRRRTGPNWKSLTAPAILPTYVGYFPTQSEVDHAFTFSIHNITLKEFDKTFYTSNKDLLMEMVRQRLIQDYQLVPPSHVNASNLRRETLRDGLANRGYPHSSISDENSETMRQFLSMGHRLQVLTYDKGTDIIEVTRYDLKTAQSSQSNTVQYQYLCFCTETKQYNKVTQTFNKYNRPYIWNKVDRIICGDDDREMREGMRFRRIMFGLVPPKIDSDAAEQEYLDKFHRLLEYLNKLKEKDDSQTTDLNVKIVKKADKIDTETDQVSSTPGIARNSMERFYVDLRKNKRDALEWMEVVIDSTLDTSWSYRIMLHWLVASSGKVDNQIQLLQRRCTQYGLDLKPFPQITVSRNVFLNPFRAPEIFLVKDKERAGDIDRKLMDMDFIHDGVFYTDAKSILKCTKFDEFDLGNRRTSVLGRQFVHRSGTLFVRLLSDQHGHTMVVATGNYSYIAKDRQRQTAAQEAFNNLAKLMNKY